MTALFNRQFVMKEKEKPVSFRLSEPWLNTLKDLRSVTGISVQQILSDATALYLGKKDPLAESRRSHVVQAVEKGKVQRPFRDAQIVLTTATV